jgi:hypothetical protein
MSGLFEQEVGFDRPDDAILVLQELDYNTSNPATTLFNVMKPCGHTCSESCGHTNG